MNLSSLCSFVFLPHSAANITACIVVVTIMVAFYDANGRVIVRVTTIIYLHFTSTQSHFIKHSSNNALASPSSVSARYFSLISGNVSFIPIPSEPIFLWSDTTKRAARPSPTNYNPIRHAPTRIRSNGSELQSVVHQHGAFWYALPSSLNCVLRGFG